MSFLDRLCEAHSADVQEDTTERMQALIVELSAMSGWDRARVTCGIRNRDFVACMLEAALNVIAQDRGFPVEGSDPYEGPEHFVEGETLSSEELNRLFDALAKRR